MTSRQATGAAAYRDVPCGSDAHHRIRNREITKRYWDQKGMRQVTFKQLAYEYDLSMERIRQIINQQLRRNRRRLYEIANKAVSIEVPLDGTEEMGEWSDQSSSL